MNYTIKVNADGNSTRFKARWVTRGFTQKHGVDYEDTYASVNKPATVKIMLALAAKLDLEFKQFDLVTAFLIALIKKYQNYVEMPMGLRSMAQTACNSYACYNVRSTALNGRLYFGMRS